MNADNLFPTMLYSTTVDTSEWRDNLLADIASWQKEIPVSLGRSDRGGAWHSPTNAMRRSAFNPVTKAVIAFGTSVFRAEKYLGNSRVRLDAMWANVLPPSGYHVPHMHLPALWSGVFYLKVPENAPEIVFMDPRPAAEAVRPELAPGQILKQDRRTVSIKEGLVVLFPGWLGHYVAPHQGDSERVAISFNLRQVIKPRLTDLPSRKSETPNYYIHRRLLVPDELDRILSVVQDDWKTARIGGGTTDTDKRNSGVQWLTLQDPAWRWLRKRLENAAREANKKFELDISRKLTKAQVTRYGPGQFYSPHLDRGNAGPKRTLSCTITLAEAQSGGGMSFPDADTPELEAGDAVFFRADELHEALPVELGERISLVVWFEEN